MERYMDQDYIGALLKSERGELTEHDPDQLQIRAAEAFKEVITKLDYIYDVMFLEGLVRNDQFHQEKKDLINAKVRYGYITSSVTRISGTNNFRFFYRKPLALPNKDDRQFTNESIAMTAGGYGKKQFDKAASFEELSLCMNAEENYARLREQGVAIKKIKRQLLQFVDLNRLYGTKRLEARKNLYKMRKQERDQTEGSHE